MHYYKYLEIQLSNIQFIVSQEHIELLVCNPTVTHSLLPVDQFLDE